MRAQKASDDGFVTLAAFKGAHGVKGLAKLVSYTEDPADVFAYVGLVAGPARAPVTLERVGALKDGFLVRASCFASREDAQAGRGWEIAVPRSALGETGDDDAFYLTDLISLTVLDPAGGRIGEVRSVENFGAEDLLEVVMDTPIKGLGRFAFIPFRKSLVPVVDLDAGHVVIDAERWQAEQTGTTAEPQDSEAGEGEA